MKNHWLKDKLDRQFEDNLPILLKQDAETLATWWCVLNIWKWPEQLPHKACYEARWLDDSLGTKIMNWIKTKVGEKATLRIWNCYPEKYGSCSRELIKVKKE